MQFMTLQDQPQRLHSQPYLERNPVQRLTSGWPGICSDTAIQQLLLPAVALGRHVRAQLACTAAQEGIVHMTVRCSPRMHGLRIGCASRRGRPCSRHWVPAAPAPWLFTAACDCLPAQKGRSGRRCAHAASAASSGVPGAPAATSRSTSRPPPADTAEHLQHCRIP